jgi:hypothetical protein
MNDRDIIEAATASWAEELAKANADNKRLSEAIERGQFLIREMLRGSTYSGHDVRYHNAYIGGPDRLSSALARWAERPSAHSGIAQEET